MRISDWSSDVCSSDLPQRSDERLDRLLVLERLDDCDHPFDIDAVAGEGGQLSDRNRTPGIAVDGIGAIEARRRSVVEGQLDLLTLDSEGVVFAGGLDRHPRSEEHTSELQSLMRISYAVFCLTKKINT